MAKKKKNIWDNRRNKLRRTQYRNPKDGKTPMSNGMKKILINSLRIGHTGTAYG